MYIHPYSLKIMQSLRQFNTGVQAHTPKLASAALFAALLTPLTPLLSQFHVNK